MVAEMPRFKQHRFADLAEFAQQVVVLHVARADLQDIGVLSEQRDLRLVHHFADHQQAAPVRRFAHHFQALFAQALKTVGRTARLERAAADHLRAAIGNDIRASVRSGPGSPRCTARP